MAECCCPPQPAAVTEARIILEQPGVGSWREFKRTVGDRLRPSDPLISWTPQQFSTIFKEKVEAIC